MGSFIIFAKVAAGRERFAPYTLATRPGSIVQAETGCRDRVQRQGAETGGV